MSWGKNSFSIYFQSLKYLALIPFWMIPRDMWRMARMTEIFILNEFRKISSYLVPYQIGSIPAG